MVIRRKTIGGKGRKYNDLAKVTENVKKKKYN